MGRIKAVERPKSCDHLDKYGMGQILVMMGMRYVLVTLLWTGRFSGGSTLIITPFFCMQVLKKVLYSTVRYLQAIALYN